MEKMANTSDGGGGYLGVFGIGRIVGLIFRNYQSAVQQVADLVPNPARYFDFLYIYNPNNH
jgi:hypothetical protein